MFHVVNRGVLKQTIFHDHGTLSTFVGRVSRYVAHAGASVLQDCRVSFFSDEVLPRCEAGGRNRTERRRWRPDSHD